MTSFGWLHLTDLHLGMDQMLGLLPAIEDNFFADLRRMHKDTAPWDLVIFTGDLTFKGSTDEFNRVDDFLKRLWALFQELEENPSLVAVPGNHDLVRPDLNKNQWARLLRNSWDTDRDIPKQFWDEPKCDYRLTVTTAFENYSRWWENTQYKLTSPRPGELPGDFSAVLRKDDASIGIVGLNTAFLQLTGASYMGKLTVDPIQFQKVCDENGPAWVKQHNTCLLLTHHPPDWLNKTAKEQLESDISSFFDAHLFGHMHASRYEPKSPAGAPEMRSFQATSLFGHDELEDSPENKRRHGYALGRIDLNGEKGEITIWPRQANRVGNRWNFGVVDGKDIYTEREHTLPREFTLKKSLLSQNPSTTVTVNAPESTDDKKEEKRWAIMIGVNNYEYFPKLSYGSNDAIDMARAFREKLDFHEVLEFHEEAKPEFQPTRDRILKKLADKRDARECQPEDLLVFYFSGHGINEDGKDYLLPIDARPKDVDTMGIRVKDLIKLLKGFGCANTMFFIDACRETDQGAKGPTAIGEDSSTLISNANMVAFFSCDPRERSFEIDQLQHGSFTYCILEAIEQSAVSTVDELDRYLQVQVPKINDKYDRPPQQPRSVIVPRTRGQLRILPYARGQSQMCVYLKDRLLILKQQEKINDDDFVSAVAFLDRIAGKPQLYANDTTLLKFVRAFCEGQWKPETFSEMWNKMLKAMDTRRLPAPELKKPPSSLK